MNKIFAAILLAFLGASASFAAAPPPPSMTLPQGRPSPVQGGSSAAAEPQADAGLLSEYESRLFPEHPCKASGSCAQIQSISLSKNAAGGLTVELEIHALIDSEFQLPSISGGRLAVDGELLRMGAAGPVAKASAGTTKHLVRIMPSADTVVMNFKQQPKHIFSSGLSDWTTSAEAGSLSTIILAKTARPQEAKGKEPQAQEPATDIALAPFVEARRVVMMDEKGANMEISFSRKGSVVEPASIQYPLASGERVLSEGVVVEGGMAKIDFEAGSASAALSTRWDYAGKPLELKASGGARISESWIVQPWRRAPLKIQGLAPLKAGGGQGYVFMPYPGDAVTLASEKLEKASGSPLAIDSVALVTKIGESNASHDWSISLRATIATPFKVEFPKGLKLLAIRLNGQAFSAAKDGDAMVFDVPPGSSRLDVSFEEAGRVVGIAKAPVAVFDRDVSNFNWTVAPASNEWVLLSWGGSLGPVILIWGVFVTMAFLSKALAMGIRFPGAPSMLGWLALLVPLSALSPWSALIIVGFAALLEFKHLKSGSIKDIHWNTFQLSIFLGFGLCAMILMSAFYQGLLGEPDMMVTGNGSNGALLRWYQDVVRASASQAAVGSGYGLLLAPMWLWRVSMLLWALWIAKAAGGRLRPIWDLVGLGGFWRAKQPKPPVATKVQAIEPDRQIDKGSPSGNGSAVADVAPPVQPDADPKDSK